MDKEIYGIFTVCNGTSKEWKVSNPILEQGEIGYDSTINQIKVGNGKDKWEYLPYVDNNDVQYEDLYNHINNRNNPHNVTYTQVNAVPYRLSVLQNAIDTGKGFREQTNLYVNNPNGGFKMSLQDIKNMNTKIISVDNIEDINFDKLSKDDYVYLKNN